MELTVDTSELAREGRRLCGEYPVAMMQRLASLLSDAQGALAWELRGWRTQRPEGGADDFMALSTTARVAMPCVRCNGPVSVALSVQRSYRVVGSEEEAERLDLEDPEHDVLAGGRHFDLAALVEDEAIMALPPTPRHEQCDLPLAQTEVVPAEQAPAPGPFAALAKLRKGPQNTDIIED